jgi:hypothetical protein
LTFLGVLLTENGPAIEESVNHYLCYVRNRCLSDPEFSTVQSKEVEEALTLTNEGSQKLWDFLCMSGLTGSGGRSQDAWSTTVPNDVDILVKAESSRKFLRARVMKHYRPGLPLKEGMQWPTLPKAPGIREFDFVRNAALRAHIENDWAEVWRVREVKAWKSCVMLSGAILEGMLLDVLTIRVDDATASYRALRNRAAPPIVRWNLIDLVDVAEHLQIVSGGVPHLSHALREYRNLVHPGRQLADDVRVTEEEAEIAFNVVRVCRRALAGSSLSS